LEAFIQTLTTFLKEVFAFDAEYTDELDIEILVRETATSTKRVSGKANEWLDKLRAQDVMTVGDLRDLQEEDWQSLYKYLM
jgi:hypothetical protein